MKFSGLMNFVRHDFNTYCEKRSQWNDHWSLREIALLL